MVIALLLLVLSPFNGWCWDRTQSTDYYELQKAEFGADWQVLVVVSQETSDRICIAVQDPDGTNLIFYIVVACNVVGCSPTEHGAKPGDGYDPVLP